MQKLVFPDRERIIITIDGPAGAGKSTISRMLARKIGFLYLDTGSMYRTAAYLSLKLEHVQRNENNLIKLLKEATLQVNQGKQGSVIILDGFDITSELRTPAVSNEATRIATWSGIRKVLVKLQRNICKRGNFVVEGRDIGTVVFPETPFKFYLDATIKERVFRRQKQLREQNIEKDIAELKIEIEARDHNDKNRADSPLKQASDAVFVDSTNLNQTGVVEKIIDEIEIILKNN